MSAGETIAAHVARLHAGGLVDLHFDLPLGLFLRCSEGPVVRRDFLPQFDAGAIGLLGVALYVEDRYVLAESLRIALDQVALLTRELENNPRLSLCKNFPEIETARSAGKIALLLTMEGAEPFGEDLHLVSIFHQLGLRALMLTHARENKAAAGGVFAPSGSPAHGLTDFGRGLVQECQRLGIILDLAHINPAGFEEIVALTKGPLIVSHSNARHFHDIERNISDEQIRLIGARGGVIGVNAILVSPRQAEATLDRYVDHIEYIAGLIGIDGVGLGFDFCDFLWDLMPPDERAKVEQKLTRPFFLPELKDHTGTGNLTRKLIKRGFSDEQIEKILRGNWLRVLRRLL